MGLYEINFIMKGKAVREQKIMKSNGIEDFIKMMAEYGHVVESVRDMEAPAVAAPPVVAQLDIEVEVIDLGAEEHACEACDKLVAAMEPEPAADLAAAMDGGEIDLDDCIVGPDVFELAGIDQAADINCTGPDSDEDLVIDMPVKPVTTADFWPEGGDIHDGLQAEAEAEAEVKDSCPAYGRCPRILDVCRLCRSANIETIELS